MTSSIMIVGPADGHFERLQARYPDSTMVARADGSKHVAIPLVQLPPGWNQPETGIAFIVPVGYPVAAPDCFYADETLRLIGGAMPKNSALQPIPHTGETRLWFSWHPFGWSVARDDLLSFVGTVRRRFDALE